MGTLFPLNSTWHFKLLSIYFIVYFFTLPVLYCQRFWIIGINQQPGMEPDTTNKEPGAFDILPILDGCITHIYWYQKIWGCAEKKKEKKWKKKCALFQETDRHCQWATGYCFCSEALDSFGEQQRKQSPEQTSLVLGKSPGTSLTAMVLHQCNWGGPLKFLGSIRKPTLKAWLQIQSLLL